jgi:hypothetical protein
MSILNQSIEAGGASPPAEVKVWDPFVQGNRVKRHVTNG